MNSSLPSETVASPPSTGRGRAKEAFALLLFLVIGFVFAAPCLCVGGEIRGRFTLAVLFLAFCRLAWQVHKRTFRWESYSIYLSIVMLFSLWADAQIHK